MHAWVGVRVRAPTSSDGGVCTVDAGLDMESLVADLHRRFQGQHRFTRTWIGDRVVSLEKPTISPASSEAEACIESVRRGGLHRLMFRPGHGMRSRRDLQILHGQDRDSAAVVHTWIGPAGRASAMQILHRPGGPRTEGSRPSIAHADLAWVDAGSLRVHPCKPAWMVQRSPSNVHRFVAKEPAAVEVSWSSSLDAPSSDHNLPSPRAPAHPHRA
jgi:hypothetical protein